MCARQSSDGLRFVRIRGEDRQRLRKNEGAFTAVFTGMKTVIMSLINIKREPGVLDDYIAVYILRKTTD